MRTRILTLLFLALPAAITAQPGFSIPTPPPGRAYLFTLDLQGTPLDEFPAGVKALNGTMTVVDKDGQHMLRASSPSEFLITLPQPLPPDFTVEVDLIPKSCCNPEDFMLEGTPTRNRGVASAELTWHSSHIMAVGGGGEMYQSDTPADLAASTPGTLTHLVVVVQGSTIKLYTNGRRMYTLDKQFARGRVLRVWLGGQDEGLNAVYLAGFAVRAGASAPGVIMGVARLPGGAGGSANPQINTAIGSISSGATGATSGPAGPGSGTASQSLASTGSAFPTVVSNVSVTQGTSGPVVNWLPVSVPAVYSVRRWKIDNPSCCNNASPPTPVLNGPPWQDAPLPITGTYVYEVTATMSGGVASGQAQFLKLSSGGPIAAVAPSAAPVTAVLVSPTSSGTITPSSPAPGLPNPSSLPTLAPPPPAPISAPIAPAPIPGRTSTLALGPATLTAAPIGWGVELRWPEVAGGVEYQLEASSTGQTFAGFATLGTQYQPPQAGIFSRAVQNMQPGSTTFYRVRAVLGDGTVTPYSPVARHDAPLQVPYVSRLATAYVGLLSSFPLASGEQLVRWGWAEITGVDDATAYAIQTDVFARDATGALIPVPGGSKRSGSSTNMYENVFKVMSGNSVRFCISVVFPPTMTAPLQYALCQMTDIP
jgi:hypothetical protein